MRSAFFAELLIAATRHEAAAPDRPRPPRRESARFLTTTSVVNCFRMVIFPKITDTPLRMMI